MNGDTGNPELLTQIRQSASEIIRLMGEADSEINKLGGRLNDLNSKPPRNPTEAAKSADNLAAGCEIYAQALETILPHFKGQIATLTAAYSGYIKSLDLETKEGRGELKVINERLEGMIASFKSTAAKAKNMRDLFHQLSEKNHSLKLTTSARKLVGLIDKLSVVYEEMETFGLKTMFLTEEKDDMGEDNESTNPSHSFISSSKGRKNIKMFKLLLDQNIMNYSGVFEEPAFSLWKKDKVELVESIYKAFSNYDIALSDISVRRDDEDIDEESITVNFENLGDYTFKISGVECSANEAGIDNYKLFFEVLEHANNWLRQSSHYLEYSVHVFELGGHGKFDGPHTSQDYLGHFDNTSMKLQSISPNTQLPNGLIFNWNDTVAGGRCHLELDHSIDIEGGLFFRWLLVAEKGESGIDKGHFAFRRVGSHSLNVLKKVLAELNLTVEDNI